MEIAESARKHGIADDEMLHALDNAFRVVEQEYDGEIRTLVIGADHSGRLLELIVVDDGPTSRIIHADVLRPKFYDYLNR
ncbi:MAG TPA: hypothetical protein VIP77_19425 [Jiangellaceae bacterium]